ncbi:MAG TPA: hydantoinase B/oxoprolinase family protein, partial [Candidatus Dormibacteraeota bacterium]|nr:hydantoinase B/oxoprolinase family protein [Candidatus Dormibacteraeota bacterium]
VIMGALARAVPDQIPACGGGQGAIAFVAAPEFETGVERVSILQPLIGGSGGRPEADGTDGVDFVAGFYRNIPTEVLEHDAPVLVERYGLRQDGGGPGRSRGGLGLDYALRVLSPRAIVTCRGLERFRFRPWGRAGGEPGSQGFARLVRAEGEVEELPRFDLLELGPGDRLEIGTPCGAGYGWALDRPPELVREDVLDGYVSEAAARERYGVVIVDGAVDAAATEALRARLRRRPPPDFEQGPERAAYEAVWTDALQDAVNAAVWTYPAGIRGVVRERLQAELARRLPGQEVDPEAVAGLAAEIVETMRRRLYR